MKRNCGIVLLAFLALLGAAGCRNAVTSQGKPCYGISQSDERKLIETARISLSKASRLVSGAEYARYVEKEDPSVTTRYNGDLFGSVKITWKLPKRTVSIIFHGELMTSEMSATAEVVPVPDENDIIYDNVPGKNGVPQKSGGFRRAGQNR